jgi:hypothetical protein
MSPAVVKFDPAEWLDKHWSPECLEHGWFEYHATLNEAYVARDQHNREAHRVYRAECRECPWRGDYGDGQSFPTPSTQMGFHVMFSGHEVELVDAPQPPDPCCEPDYDPSRGGYVHDSTCHGYVEL